MDNTIDIKGITRSTSMLQSEDGESEDLLNLRYKDGSWRIAGKGDEVYKLPADYKRLYIHTNVYRHLLGIKDNWLWWIADIDSDGYFKTLDQAIQLCNATESMHISQTGNLLTVIDGENRNYILWNNNYEKYEIQSGIDYNGEINDSEVRPYINAQFRTSIVNVIQNDTDYAKVYTYRIHADNMPFSTLEQGGNETTKNYLKAAHNALENKVKENGEFIYPFMACVALRLYDGSFAFMDRPVLITPGFDYFRGKSNAVRRIDGPRSGGKWSIMSSFTEEEYGNFMFNFSSNAGMDTVTTEYKNECSVCSNSENYVYIDRYPDGLSYMPDNTSPSNIPDGFRLLQDANNRQDFPPICDHKEQTKVGQNISAHTAYSVYATPRVLQFKLDRNKLKQYSDIVSKISIFITPCVNVFDYDADNYEVYKCTIEKYDYNAYDKTGDKYYYNKSNHTLLSYRPPYKSHDNRLKEFNTNFFYLLKEYEIHQITGDWQTVEIDDGVLSNITQQDRLPIDASDRSAYYPKYTYSYNGRLHLANYMQKYFLGWPLNYFYGTPKNGMYDVNQETSNRCELCTAVSIGETSMVVRRPDDEDSSSQSIHYPYDLMPMLSYPSNEAKKMRVLIWYEQEINGRPYKKVFNKTYDLTPHIFYNFSYYITEDFSPIPIEFGKGIPSSISIPESEKDYNYYPNGLKVSSVDNPLVFPSSSTYLVGSSEIVGMCSNTIAVGTGQTGSAPLYVFSKDGIYALFVDSSGEMTYTNARPIARDVCDNPDSITPIDDGVVFTTGRGLMIISGESVREISEPLEGDFLDFANQESANGYIKMASNAFSNVLLGNFESNELVKEVFLDYIKNSIIAYNHSERELMVANPSTGYMYVMDRYGNWSRRSDNAKEFINNYPVTYRYENNILYSVHSDNCTYANVFMLTRAVKLGTVNFKQGYRFVLRGYFETTGIPLESSSASGSVDYASTSIFAGMYGYDSVGWYGKVMFPGKSYRISYKNMGVNPVKLGVGLKTYDDKNLWDLIDNAYCDPGGSREFTVELPTTKYDIFKVEKVCLFVFSGSDEPVGDYSVEYEVFDMSSYAGLYVFGSYDGRRWAFIGGNEKSGAFTDFGCLVSRVDCKFFRACLCGMLSSSSRIDYMEMVSDGSRILGKKIR